MNRIVLSLYLLMIKAIQMNNFPLGKYWKSYGSGWRTLWVIKDNITFHTYTMSQSFFSWIHPKLIKQSTEVTWFWMFMHHSLWVSGIWKQSASPFQGYLQMVTKFHQYVLLEWQLNMGMEVSVLYPVKIGIAEAYGNSIFYFLFASFFFFLLMYCSG